MASARSSRVSLVLLGLLALAAASCGGNSRVADPPITVFVVRHAEKADDGGDDPPLSEAGQARAARLYELLSRAGVTHAFATDYLRTKQTLLPIAGHARAGIHLVAPEDTANLVKRIRGLDPGSVAVVAGHSNTVPAILRALGAELPDLGESLPEDAYDRLWVVVIDPDRTFATELRY
jgi:phosphohistidine phosphatase SixA